MLQSSPEHSRSDRRILKPVFRLAERAMTYPVTVTRVSALALDLAQVTLQAEQFRDAAWQPGDKIDVEVAELSYRAYTPSAVNRRLGHLEILVFDHGHGSGSRRLCASQPGETLRVRGPKPSTLMDGQPGTLFLAGDETSLGLLVARKSQDPEFTGAHALIEATAPSSLTPVLAKLGLEATTLLKRASSEAHLTSAVQQVSAFLENRPDRKAILTGQAASIQSIRRQLLAQGICKSNLVSHAFWAQGKIALG